MMNYSLANSEYIFKQKQRMSLIIFVLICAIVVCFNTFCTSLIETIKVVNYDKVTAELKAIKDSSGLSALSDINSDFTAWISISDLNIELPVVSTKSTADEDYYLNHDFKKRTNKLGSPYQKHDTLLSSTTNTVFVGHSAYQGNFWGKEYVSNLFGKLNSYVSADQNFDYTIKVQTSQQTYSFKVISLLKFYNTDYSSDEFAVYRTTNLNTQKQFDNFYNTLKTQSLIDFDLTAEFGDKFLSMLTCCTDDRDFRLLVVAKQV